MVITYIDYKQIKFVLAPDHLNGSPVILLNCCIMWENARDTLIISSHGHCCFLQQVSIALLEVGSRRLGWLCWVFLELLGHSKLCCQLVIDLFHL